MLQEMSMDAHERLRTACDPCITVHCLAHHSLQALDASSLHTLLKLKDCELILADESRAASGYRGSCPDA